jgi:DNA mismatch endonuclease (patch repair protein)
MTDVFTKAKRSQVMSRIRGHGNKDTELAVFGKPDFIFPRRKVAVFVDGCFWHSCPLHATQPRNNAAFWQKKFAANTARDRLVQRTLRRAGWRVLRLWEHELARKREARLVARLRRVLTPNP